MAEAARAHLDWQQAVLSRLGWPLAPGSAYLDFGCGENGGTVPAALDAGFDAFGCDLELSETGRLRQIETPYRLPFDDETFDFVGSMVVLEHVMNPQEAFREIHRVLKPGGTSLHTFPGRWTLIEQHTYVPLATVIRARPWLRLWALAGVRNEFQQGLPACDVVERNQRFLVEHTSYPTRRRIRRAGAPFQRVVFAEAAAIAQASELASRVPLADRVYSAIRSRVLFLER